MEFQFIKYEKRGRIATVTFNRPDLMNAVHPPANAELSQAWDDFAADPDVWVGIVTGAGDRAFSAGNDLHYTAQHAGDQSAPALPRRGGWGGMTTRVDLWKPIIAAVNGWAVGGGCEVALACDIIIAAENAHFGLPEPRRGLVAGGGGVQRLPRQIPFKIAMGMILTGKAINAQEAYRVGLVNEVVPLKDLMPTAERWANEILECAPLAVRGAKESAYVGVGMPLEAALRHTYQNVVASNKSEDRVEGPRAFSEGRKPNWKGL